MSIILDALKKAQSSKQNQQPDNTLPADTNLRATETAGGETISAPSQEGTSPVTKSKPGMFDPKPSHSSAPQKNSKRRVILLAMVAVAGLAILLFFKQGPQTTTDTPLNLAPKKIAAKQGGPSPTTDTASDEKSQKDLEKAEKLSAEATGYFNEKKFDKGMYVFKQLTEMMPTESEYYNNYGLSLKKMGKTNEARLAYNTALALRPDYPEALNNLAVIEMSEKKYNDARRRLERAILLQPDYLDPYLHLAICLEKTGDIETAVQYYKSFLEMSEGRINRKIRLQIENRLAKLNEDMK